MLTGAGISTESGIPDFRGPNGVWTKNPAAEKAANIEYYVSDPEVRARAWQNRVRSEIWQAEPNAGHRALADLEHRVGLDALLTQNIDGLHQAAGSTPASSSSSCTATCARRSASDATGGARCRRPSIGCGPGETDPRCVECGGILKSATVSFGESLVAADLERANAPPQGCDLFLAVGTSLGVYPAAALPEIALRNGARLDRDERRAHALRRPGRRRRALPARAGAPPHGRRCGIPDPGGWEYPTQGVGFTALCRVSVSC